MEYGSNLSQATLIVATGDLEAGAHRKMSTIVAPALPSLFIHGTRISQALLQGSVMTRS